MLPLSPSRAFSCARTLVCYAVAVARLRLSRRASLILRYHSVGPREETEQYASPGISLTPDRFDRQVRFLIERYDVIGPEEAVRRARDGRSPGSRPGVVLTFDDGYRDNHRYALPVLRRHGATAVFYVVAGCLAPGPAPWTARLRAALRGATTPNGPVSVPVEVDVSDPRAASRTLWQLKVWLRGLPATVREREMEGFLHRMGPGGASADLQVMMEKREVRDLEAAGMTIGAHTMTHPLLPELTEDEAKSEIEQSRRVLEQVAESPVLHFSYPNPGTGNHQGERERRLVRNAGYHTAVTSRAGIVFAGSDPFELPRFGVGPGAKGRLLFRLLGEKRT